MVTATATATATVRIESAMPKRTGAARRSLPGLPFKTIFALLAGAVVAAAAGADALAMATRFGRPSVALALLPNEPIALSRMATIRLVQAVQEKQPTPPLREMLKRSLAGQALNPVALRLLALPERGPLDRNVDYQLVHLSDKVSRRDLATQALLILEGGLTKNLKAVLRSYDNALRTTQESQSLLFPQLVKAIELPEMAPYFASYLRERPPWLSPFLIYAAASSESPETFARLIQMNGGVADLDRSEEIDFGFINALLSRKRNYAAAREYYLSTSGAKPAALSAPTIFKDTIEPAGNGLLWQLYDERGRGAEALLKRAILAFAETDKSGPVARKLLFLAPGRYRLSGRYEDAKYGDGGGASWSVTCASQQDRLLATMPIPLNKGNYGSSMEFDVELGCGAVTLELGLDGGASREGSELLIASLDLRPARASAAPAMSESRR